MQFVALNKILEQKNEHERKTGEIQTKFVVSLIVLYEWWFFSVDQCALVL